MVIIYSDIISSKNDEFEYKNNKLFIQRKKVNDENNKELICL